jgi:hypothetical protein
MAISKSDARKLAINVSEMGAQVLRGVLTVGPEGAKINGVDVLDWLSQHTGSEVVLIATPVGSDVSAGEEKTCSRCGRDYRGETCPYCAEARARLRG